MTIFDRPLPLRCAVQQYSWGKLGTSSLVRELARCTGDGPYAELWIGAHSTAPSEADVDGRPVRLDHLLRDYPVELLGEEVCRRFGPTLPFLLKVLSVRTALSLQAHPTKAQAAALHRRSPARYPDSNHKPEIAIALTPVSLLSGLRSNLLEAVEQVPELRLLWGKRKPVDCESVQQAMQQLLTDPDAATLSSALVTRLRAQGPRQVEEEWVLRIAEEFPSGDPGLFAPFLFHLVELSAREAIFTPPETPHAYLAGDLVECMANSDNVVRAALTEKPRDVDTFVDMLTTNDPPVKCAVREENRTRTYLSAAEEFSVSQLLPRPEPFDCSGSLGPQLLLSLSDTATLSSARGWTHLLRRGDAFFVPACATSCNLVLSEGTVFRACVQSSKQT